jgi:hypothetical protein
MDSTVEHANPHNRVLHSQDRVSRSPRTPSRCGVWGFGLPRNIPVPRADRVSPSSYSAPAGKSVGCCAVCDLYGERDAAVWQEGQRNSGVP